MRRHIKILLIGVMTTALMAMGMVTTAQAAGHFTGISNPTITGTRAVGKKLTAKPDTITTPKASSLTYQWLRNGAKISKATGKTYTTTASDKGKKLQVKVCYKRSGYTTRCVTSAKTAAVKAGAFTGVSNPRITGTLAVGKKLTAAPDTATTPKASGLTYQWLRNGASISKATGKTYTATASDKGKKLSVKVCYKRTGYTTRCVTSATTTAIKTGTLTAPTPTTTGTATAAQTLTVKPGTWTAGTTLTYQWLRNGKTIPGATGKTYKLWADDVDKRISVKVTGKKTGYTTTAKTSVPTRTVGMTAAQQGAAAWARELLDYGVSEANFGIWLTDVEPTYAPWVDFTLDLWKPNWTNQAILAVTIQKKDFGKARIEEDLTYYGFSPDQVAAAMATLADVDWKARALATAQTLADEVIRSGSVTTPEYLSRMLGAYLYGFQTDEVDHALAMVDVDWNLQATTMAERIADYHGFSWSRVRKALSEDKGFSDEAIQYAHENANVTWQD